MGKAKTLQVTKKAKEPLETAAQSATSNGDNHAQLAALAYELWLQRGCPVGSSEEDWFRAERELKNRESPGTIAASQSS